MLALQGKTSLIYIWMVLTLLNPFPIGIFWMGTGPKLETVWNAIEIGFWVLSFFVQLYELWLLLAYLGLVDVDEESDFENLEAEQIGLSTQEIEELVMRKQMEDHEEMLAANGCLHMYDYAQSYLLGRRMNTLLSTVINKR